MSLRADDTQDSNTSHLEALILGGQPIGEHVEHYGPFVMNTKAEIGQALEDFEAGRLGTIPPNALMPHVFDPAPVRAEQLRDLIAARRVASQLRLPLRAQACGRRPSSIMTSNRSL